MAQSFFDKLTGTLKVQPSEPSQTAKPIAKTEEPEVAREEPKIAPERIKLMENETKPKIEMTHNEVEGQLTVDVYQTPNEIVIKSTIAGVTIEELDISITNDMVTIRGERKKDEEVQAQDYFHQECYWGPFSRSIILPVDVDSENVAAAFKNGILTIRLPKAEKVRTKKIKIAG